MHGILSGTGDKFWGDAEYGAFEGKHVGELRTGMEGVRRRKSAKKLASKLKLPKPPKKVRRKRLAGKLKGLK